MSSHSDWRDIALGEFISLQRGHDLPEPERRPGSVPVVGSFGITGYHDRAITAHAGVTVGRSGASMGVVTYCDQPFWPLNTVLYVTDFHGNDERFTYYFLRGMDFTRYNSGSAQPSLNRNYIYPIPVRVPCLKEQRLIAFLLGALDDKIELNRRMTETLEAIARAIFQSWFVDFDPVRAKAEGGQPKGIPTSCAALFPAKVWRTSDGESVPTGWRIDELEEILSVLEVGGRPKGGVSGYATGVPSIGAQSIVGLGRFDFSQVKFVPEEFFQQMGKGHIENRDVLLYKDGGRPGEFEPHVAMFGDGFPFAKAAINEHVYRIRTTSEYSQNLLYFWLSSESCMEEMRRKGTGVAIPGLNSTAVKSLSVLIPPAPIVGAFDELCEPLVAKVLNNAKECHSLAQLRDTLLPKLLSGEIRLKEAEKAIEETV